MFLLKFYALKFGATKTFHRHALATGKRRAQAVRSSNQFEIGWLSKLWLITTSGGIRKSSVPLGRMRRHKRLLVSHSTGATHQPSRAWLHKLLHGAAHAAWNPHAKRQTLCKWTAMGESDPFSNRLRSSCGLLQLAHPSPDLPG